jgi:hypothetical protein
MVVLVLTRASLRRASVVVVEVTPLRAQAVT